MLALQARNNMALGPWTRQHVEILRVTRDPYFAPPLRMSSALLVNSVQDALEADSRFGSILIRGATSNSINPVPNAFVLSPDLDYLDDGDVIRINERSEIGVIYRLGANANSLLVTERCNSFCVMCSQPPRDVDDGFLVDELERAIYLIDPGTREIGITGGEPTLLGSRLFKLVSLIKAQLPRTALHILTNGRAFRDLDLARAIASSRHPDLMLGIPLYSDIPSIHDFVVQADGAFDETIRGILNLKRCSVRVELRIVLHKYTLPRLVQWAKFVARNLQFVDHVALMGLELVGFAKANANDLWVDPIDYKDALNEAAHHLDWAGIRTSIYNHQLCVIHPDSRRFAVPSISDWKNDYLPECLHCSARSECGGFFSTGLLKPSRAIRAILGPAADFSGRGAISPIKG